MADTKIKPAEFIKKFLFQEVFSWTLKINCRFSCIYTYCRSFQRIQHYFKSIAVENEIAQQSDWNFIAALHIICVVPIFIYINCQENFLPDSFSFIYTTNICSLNAYLYIMLILKKTFSKCLRFRLHYVLFQTTYERWFWQVLFYEAAHPN